MRILLVEGEARLSDALAEALEAECYAVDRAADGLTADELEFVNSYDLIILDWTIPPPSGIELLRRWREAGDGTPVLMLSGHPSVDERVSGLDTGADDFLTIPFSMSELMARVRSLLRRREKPLQSRLRVADINMDRAAHKVLVAGDTIELSPKEFSTLEYFLTRPDVVITRTELIEHVWDDAFDSMSNVVDVTIHRLRAKIDDDQKRKLLYTIKGVGYVLHSKRS